MADEYVALVESLPAATSRKKPMTISCSSSFSPSTSACTSTLVRSSVGASRRAAMSVRQLSKIFGTSDSTTASTPSGLRSGSPAPRVAFMSSAHMASSDSGMPMKLWMTRETAGWATSLTRSQVSRSPRRSSTRTTMARISSSCSAMRLGVKPAWNSALRRSWRGGSMPMNMAWMSSSGKA